jgi:hypothetical protein
VRVEAASLLHLNHPDIKVYMRQIYQDLVPSDSEVGTALIIGGGLTVRVMKVLEAER